MNYILHEIYDTQRRIREIKFIQNFLNYDRVSRIGYVVCMRNSFRG